MHFNDKQNEYSIRIIKFSMKLDSTSNRILMKFASNSSSSRSKSTIHYHSPPPEFCRKPEKNVQMRDTSIKRAPNAAVCTKSIRSHVIRNCICLLFTDRKCAMQGGAQRNREKMASQNISMGFSLHSQPCADDDDETKLINNLHYICVFSCLFYFFFSGMREQPSSFFLAAGFFCFVHRAISYRVPTPLCVCVWLDKQRCCTAAQYSTGCTAYRLFDTYAMLIFSLRLSVHLVSLVLLHATSWTDWNNAVRFFLNLVLAEIHPACDVDNVTEFNFINILSMKFVSSDFFSFEKILCYSQTMQTHY